MLLEDTIYCGDCLKWLADLPAKCVHLVFADPPFNIGYQYDIYEDRKGYDEYLGWTRRWIEGCCRVLKPDGAFWIAIGDDFAAEVRILGREAGLTLRNWVVWHYSFGQCTKTKFGRGHTHLLYFVNDPKNFTFNADAVRVMSDRQKEYADRRANGSGRVPEDVWSQFSRVCGTFRERRTWHPCQMPEALLARIIRACTRPADRVLDPFVGSGTTTTAAAKLGRRYLGAEISREYHRQAVRRTRQAVEMHRQAKGARNWPELHVEQLRWLYGEVELSTDELYRNLPLLKTFTALLNQRLQDLQAAYDADAVLKQLVRLRKRAQLPRIKRHVAEPNGDFQPLLRVMAGGRAAGSRSRRSSRRRA